MLFFLCFCFAINNLVRLIIRKRKLTLLILFFYCLAIVDTACHTITMIHFTIYPWVRICVYCQIEHFKAVRLFYVFGSATHLTLCWLVLATMFNTALCT